MSIYLQPRNILLLLRLPLTLYRMPRRKEVRWFTRGEFTTQALTGDGFVPESELTRRVEHGISSRSSIFSFTNSFDMATRDIAAHPETLIAVDGGPHTLWW